MQSTRTAVVAKQKFEFLTSKVGSVRLRASFHVIGTSAMDPLAVLAEMDAMDAAGLRVEKILDSDAQLRRSQAAPRLTVYPQTKRNIWTNLFLVTGRRVTKCLVTCRSQRRRTPTMSQTMAPFADVEVEQDGHMDKEDVLVSIVLDKKRKLSRASEEWSQSRRTMKVRGRTSATTECLGTATEMTVDWMDYPSSLQIEPAVLPPSWRFPFHVWEWFFKHFFSPDVVDTKVQYTN